MLNENNRSSDRILTERILDDPDMILKIENPSLKQQMAAVQKKPELIASLPLAGEKVQLAAVIACPESILLVASWPWNGCSKRNFFPCRVS